MNTLPGRTVVFCPPLSFPLRQTEGRWLALVLIVGMTLTRLAVGAELPQVTLLWDPSPGPNVAGYRLHCGTNSGTYCSRIDVRTNTTVTVSNLLTGTKYFFAATAYDGAGIDSEYSNEVAFTTPGTPPTTDTDGDGIPDDQDQCPTVAGVPPTGCPLDTDGDGIPDAQDQCPTVAGVPPTGCPLDTDGDGIPDAQDQCPTVAGVPPTGCPLDTDGDGIPDAQDQCPTVAGIPPTGCPLDTDGDGIPDAQDQCPTVAGIPPTGCPLDTDGDGIPDDQDQCPTVAGVPPTGCPLDTDGDGIPDTQDQCPTEAGVAPTGCPNAPDVPPAPVVSYAFDEGSGITAMDASTNLLNGTIQGGPRWVAGRFWRALSLDGVDDGVQLPSSALLNFDAKASFSVAAWVKTEPGYAVTSQIVAKQSSFNGTGFSLMQLNHAQSYFWVRLQDTDGDQTGYVGNKNGAYINDGNWHHVVMVVNRASNTLTLYTDGIASTPLDLRTVGTNGIGDLTNSIPIQLGGLSYRYRGSLDTFQVYRVALNAAQVATLAAAQPPPDADGDGIPDAYDQCPTLAGPEPTGCPPNSVPTVQDLTLSTLEDQALAVTLTGQDADNDPLTFTVTAVPSHGTLTGTPPNLQYTPAADYNGADAFTYTANDGHATSATATVSISVSPVNDPPRFVKGPNVVVPQGAPAQTIPAWATQISAGAANEAAQTLQFAANATPAWLFATQPTVADNGTLSFTPVSNRRGAATVTLQLLDNGGTANGGQNASPIATFTIQLGVDTDTDGDGVPDDYEALSGTNPNDANDGAADTDGDGQSNHDEYVAGTAARDPKDTLRILSVDRAGGDVVLRFRSIRGKSYQVEVDPTLSGSTWNLLASNLTGTDDVLTVTDLGGMSRAQASYRVTAEGTAHSESAGLFQAKLFGSAQGVLSFPFTRPLAACGRIQAVAANLISVSGTPGWAVNQFVYANETQPNTYFLRIRSGAKAGNIYTITANNASTITVNLAGDSLSTVVAGDRFEVYPYWTLGTAFPNGEGIQPSTSAANRGTEIAIPAYDLIGTNLPTARTNYWLNGHWYQVGQSEVRDDDVLLPDAQVYVRNPGPAATTVTLRGDILTGPWQFAVFADRRSANDNLIALPFPATLTLDQTGLQNADAFRATTARVIVDELLVYNNATPSATNTPSASYYYYKKAWRQRGLPETYNAGSHIAFSPGCAVVIRKAASNVGCADWTIESTP